MNKKIKFIAVEKDHERYLFRYQNGEEALLLKAIMSYAKDDRFNLNYIDVVQFVKKLRDMMVENLIKQEQINKK